MIPHFRGKRQGFRLPKNGSAWRGRLPYPASICKNRRPVRRFLHFSRAGRPAGPVAGRPYFLWSGGRTAILSLVRCPDGHTFFAFLRTTCPARERSMGAAACRQRGSAVWERRHSASPLQNSKKWLLPLFRKACLLGRFPLFGPAEKGLVRNAQGEGGLAGGNASLTP